MIYIVGIGPGNKDYILPKAIEILKSSNMILGFSRAIKSIDFIHKNKCVVKSLKEILGYIKDNPDINISIVASGDPGFFGITDFIKKNISNHFKIIPGISSFQYLCSKINKTWQNTYLGSVHGRDNDVINVIKENETSIWLTDKKNSPKSICEKLILENIKAKVYVGENLSYENERIIIGTPEELRATKFNDLCVVIVEKII